MTGTTTVYSWGDGIASPANGKLWSTKCLATELNFELCLPIPWYGIASTNFRQNLFHVQKSQPTLGAFLICKSSRGHKASFRHAIQNSFWLIIPVIRSLVYFFYPIAAVMDCGFILRLDENIRQTFFSSNA